MRDLAISKYVAGREKDLQFTRELARHGMTDEAVLLERLAETDVAASLRALVEGRIKAEARFRKPWRLGSRTGKAIVISGSVFQNGP